MRQNFVDSEAFEGSRLTGTIYSKKSKALLLLETERRSIDSMDNFVAIDSRLRVMIVVRVLVVGLRGHKVLFEFAHSDGFFRLLANKDSIYSLNLGLDIVIHELIRSLK